MNLQTLACPLNLPPSTHTGSSRSCLMLCRVTLATIIFSSFMANVFIPSSTWSSVIPVRKPSAFLVRFLRSWLSQHSKGCMVPPSLVAFTYSLYLGSKYCRSSVMSADDMFDLFNPRSLHWLTWHLMTGCMGSDECCCNHWIHVRCFAIASLYRALAYQHLRPMWWCSLIGVLLRHYFWF